MRVVGLTGNVAAGKSALADHWRAADVPVLSMDELAREAVEPGSRALARIRRRFGPGVISADGSLDRDALRRIAFGDARARSALERIVHPEVGRLRDEWTRRRRAAGAPLAVWEAPLLYETGMDEEVDFVVVVRAPEAVRERRMVENRGLAPEEAKAMMAAQDPEEGKAARADAVVVNDGTPAALAARAAELLDEMRRAGP